MYFFSKVLKPYVLWLRDNVAQLKGSLFFNAWEKNLMLKICWLQCCDINKLLVQEIPLGSAGWSPE